MLQLIILDFLFLFPIIFGIFFTTIAYFKFNVPSGFLKNFKNDVKIRKTFVSKKNYNYIFIKFIIALMFLIVVQLLMYRGYCVIFWNNHFFINNFFYKYIILFYKITIFLMIVIYSISINKIAFSIDYLYTFVLMFIISPLIFISNNFFIFYFILELIVCLTFLKFTVSKFWFRQNLAIHSKHNFEKFADYSPRMYSHTLFFQY